MVFLDELGVVYLHLPKTGGNYVQSQFLSLGLSRDRKTLSGHQDGTHRFGIQGQFSADKHATLNEYKAAMGPEAFSQMEVVITWRHPIPRLVSLYLSPHAWQRERSISRYTLGSFSRGLRPLGSQSAASKLRLAMERRRSYQQVTPTSFDLKEFAAMVQASRTMRDMLDVGHLGTLVTNKLYTLHFDSLDLDLAKFLALKGISWQSDPLHVNVSTNSALAERMRSDERIHDIVMSSAHAADLQLEPRPPVP